MNKRRLPLLPFICLGMLSLACGCVTLPPPAKICLMDTDTMEIISYQKDASRKTGEPWGPHDTEAILPCKLDEDVFRTIYSTGGHSQEGRWIVREYDKNGAFLAERTFPHLQLHGDSGSYAFSDTLEQIVYRTRSGGISVWDVCSGKEIPLIERAAENPPKIDWVRWHSPETVTAMIDSTEDGEYGGTVLAIDVPSREVTLLYKNDRLWNEAALSPDSRWLVVETSLPFPEPSKLVLVDTAQHSERVIFAPASNQFIHNVCWSPDGKSFAFTSDMDVYLYTLEQGEYRLVMRTPGVDGIIYRLGFLDDSRVFYYYANKGYEGKRYRLILLHLSERRELANIELPCGGGVEAFAHGKRLVLRL